MKKLVISIISVLMVCLLSSCNVVQEVQAEEEKTENTPIEEGGIYIGMTEEKARENIKSRNVEYFDYGSLMFFENEEGKNTVIHTSPDASGVFLLYEIGTFDKVVADQSAFEKIERGMSVLDVVELVGLPIGSTTFGMSSLDFECSNGTVYRIYIEGFEDIVRSVAIRNHS